MAESVPDSWPLMLSHCSGELGACIYDSERMLKVSRKDVSGLPQYRVICVKNTGVG